jgi:hypothetical protein
MSLYDSAAGQGAENRKSRSKYLLKIDWSKYFSSANNIFCYLSSNQVKKGHNFILGGAHQTP